MASALGASAVREQRSVKLEEARREAEAILPGDWCGTRPEAVRLANAVSGLTVRAASE